MTDDEFDAKANEALDHWYEDGGDFNGNWHGSLARVISTALRDAVKAERQWQPIETAPPMKGLMLFAVTHVGDDGTVRNWKMGSGFWHTGLNRWVWEGEQIHSHHIAPTHWQHLPAAPIAQVVHPPHNT